MNGCPLGGRSDQLWAHFLFLKWRAIGRPPFDALHPTAFPKSCGGLPRILTHRRGETKEGESRDTAIGSGARAHHERPRRSACVGNVRDGPARSTCVPPRRRHNTDWGPSAPRTLWRARLLDSLTHWLNDWLTAMDAGICWGTGALCVCLWVCYSVSECVFVYFFLPLFTFLQISLTFLFLSLMYPLSGWQSVCVCVRVCI